MLTIISFEFNLRNFTLILTHQFEIYIINHIQMVVECAMYALNDFTGFSQSQMEYFINIMQTYEFHTPSKI